MLVRVTLAYIPDSLTDEIFKEKCVLFRNYILKMIKNNLYADCFEQDKKNQTHFHCCFTLWNHKGFTKNTEDLKHIVRQLFLEKELKFIGSNNGGFNCVKHTKGTVGQFVGYLYKDEGEIFATGEWENLIEEFRTEYMDGILNAKWSTKKIYNCVKAEIAKLKEEHKAKCEINDSTEEFKYNLYNIINKVWESAPDNVHIRDIKAVYDWMSKC